MLDLLVEERVEALPPRKEWYTPGWSQAGHPDL